MKIQLLLALILLAGCAAPKSGQVTVTPRATLPVGEDIADTVRYRELLKGYHVGRYVDPHNRLVMHEGHRVYRVESLAAWNFHSPPQCETGAVAISHLTNSAFVPPRLSDEAIAELNRQREVTQAVTRQAQTLNDSLKQFSDALTATRSVAQQNQRLRDQVTNAEKRIEALETELRRKSQPNTTPAQEP